MMPHVFSTILACSVCLPEQSSDVARAANMMLVFMVVVVFLMLATFLKIIFNFARREREHQQNLSEP